LAATIVHDGIASEDKSEGGRNHEEEEGSGVRVHRGLVSIGGVGIECETFESVGLVLGGDSSG
jgi:hypothetical protein